MLTVREKLLKSAHCKELQSNIPINNYFGTPVGKNAWFFPSRRIYGDVFMPIFKTANGKGKYRDLKSKEQVIGYVMNPEKTPHKLYGGAGIDFDNIAESMNEVSDKFNKSDGVQCRHYIVSFQHGEVSSYKQAANIADEFAEYLGREYQTVYAVHENTANPHIHIVTNSVSYIDGHRYYGTKKEHMKMMNGMNGILARHHAGKLIYISNK